MDHDLLHRHIKNYMQKLQQSDSKEVSELNERKSRIAFFQSWTPERIAAMTETDLYDFMSKLWAMLIWGNKKYYVDKIIHDNGFDNFKKHLSTLLWGSHEIASRWDTFREEISGLGPAMISEILSHVYPDKCMVWNRRAYVALDYLKIRDLPIHNYQLTGQTYERLSSVCADILRELQKHIPDSNLLTLDYFFWDELQVKDNLSRIFEKEEHEIVKDVKAADKKTSQFIHNEIRDKLYEIGKFLGFKADTEVHVADGSVVDTTWEATIGNMGRVIYVFEVQVKGSCDSLVMNLMKSMSNPAVQGVVAVSDKEQLEKIKKEVASLREINGKLRYLNYEDVLAIHEHLQFVNEIINSLRLVPQGFCEAS